MTRRSFAPALLVLAVVMASCTSQSSTQTLPASDITADVTLELVAAIPTPVAFATRNGDGPDVVYVASQSGEVHRLHTRTGAAEMIASFTERTRADGERGLLGLAFSRTGDEMYAHFTDLDGNTNVVAVRFVDGIADMTTMRTLLFVEQPFANHNGGQLVVDGDGNLLIGLGDGGSGGDPLGNAQNPNSLLGKILRISPNPSSSPTPYSIPAANPFVDSNDAAPEILFLGLRNPWRFSIDAETGDFWIADVGQNSREEIDRVPPSAAGANFGWNLKEGTRPYEGSSGERLVDPVYDWPNEGGSAAIGGFVYRGTAIDGLRGRYVFADLARTGLLVLDPGTGDVARLDLPIDTVVAFGEDRSGELYVLSLTSGVHALRPS